jgi:hypothetical protein
MKALAIALLGAVAALVILPETTFAAQKKSRDAELRVTVGAQKAVRRAPVQREVRRVVRRAPVRVAEPCDNGVRREPDPWFFTPPLRSECPRNEPTVRLRCGCR